MHKIEWWFDTFIREIEAGALAILLGLVVGLVCLSLADWACS